MPLSKEETTYAPIPEGVSIQSEADQRESEELFFDGGFPIFRRKDHRIRSIVLFVVGGLLFLLPYTFITVKITSVYWKNERLHGASVINCNDFPNSH